MPEERSVTARADQNLRYRGAGSQSPILTAIIPFAFTQFTHVFPTQYHDNSGHTTRMPVTTRSTTRKTRSAAVCAKPPPPEGAAQGTSKPSSKTTSKPSFSKRKYTKSLSKVALKAATKRSPKAAQAEAELAACKAEEVERVEQVVRTLVLGSSSSSYIHRIFLSQRREWAAVVAKNPPLKTLTPDDLPQSGKEVPHRLYGWPFSEDYMLDYARRHRLVFHVIPYYRKVFGDDYFNYGDITDDHLRC